MSEKFTPEPEVPQEEPLASKGKPEVSVKLPESPDIKIDIEKKEIIILSEGTETGEKRHPFQEFMYHLRGEGIRVSTGEWLDLQTLLAAGEVQSLDELYVVARAVLVKDAVNYPKYDVAFGKLFYGIEPPSEEEEENEDSYDEQNDYDDPQDGTESEDALREKAEVEEKEKKKKKPIQKEKEDIDEVEEATSKTTEDKHGGDEATKDIEDSPNPADEGKNKENKGAEKGEDGSEGKGEGEGGEKKTKKGTVGEGGKNKSGMGKEGEGEEEEETDEADETDEKKESKKGTGKSGGGGGKHKKKSKESVMRASGKGGYASARERVQQREYEELRDDRTLGYEQFGRALSKLRTIVQETTSAKTRTLDARATVRAIAEHAGTPELLWKEEVEEKPSVVLLFDVGGSTDEYRPILEKLFSAAKDHLEGLEVYYFHNAIYGEVWPQKDGNWGKHFVPVSDILKKDSSTKFIIIGDAWMADSDAMNGGLHDSYLDLDPDAKKTEPCYRWTGLENFQAITEAFPATVWVNPILEKHRDDADDSGTIADVERVITMYDLSLRGIEAAVKKLMEEEQ